MALDPITAILNVGEALIDRLIPDKTAAAAAKAQLLTMQVQGELDEIKGQLVVNQAEASSQSTFVAGWRPFVGWCCGAAFAYVYILQPMAQFLLVAFKVNFDVTKLPSLDIADMMPVLLGMLGLGAMRSFDKQSGNGNGH
jgi:Holin of 3TMs, for gene-transfer release